MPKHLVLALLMCFAVLSACGRSSDSGDSVDSVARRPASAIPPLDPQNVPADLRHLIPLAQQWGIGDDVERLAKVDGATPAQRADLRGVVAPQQTRITQWLDSFGQGLMSQEAATFMYMQLAIEEITGCP
jgi:hypothetical protein